MNRRIPPDAPQQTDGVEVVRIGVDGDVAVERLAGRAIRSRCYALSLLGLLALYAGYFMIMTAGTVVVAKYYSLPLPRLDPELNDLVQRYLRSPAILWLGYGISPTAILCCLFLSGVDMRREQPFWIFFFVTVSSIVIASWKAVLPKYWLGTPIFSFFLWIVAYGESATFGEKLRRRLARRRV